jgi:cytochrome c2
VKPSLALPPLEETSMRSIAAALALLLLAACASAGAQTAPTPAAPAVDVVARGAALFVNKGCITCHHNAAISYAGEIIGAGPDLSTYTSSEEFLKTWLKDPAAVRAGTAMPNLGLSEGEIVALIAFINRQR